MAAPVFSPDGAHIAYVAFVEGKSNGVYVSPAAGGTPMFVGSGGSPSWSSDGGSVAVAGRGAIDIFRLGSQQPVARILNPGCIAQHAWSPSGKWIACEGRHSIELVSPDGKARRTLPALGSYDGALTWSRDSSTLFGVPVHGGRTSLVALDVRSGKVRKIAEYDPDLVLGAQYGGALRLSLAPDGKSLATANFKSQHDLWILDGFAQ